MFSIERSFSRSNVAVPASAGSSSRPTSPDVRLRGGEGIRLDRGELGVQLDPLLFEANPQVSKLFLGQSWSRPWSREGSTGHRGEPGGEPGVACPAEATTGTSSGDRLAEASRGRWEPGARPSANILPEPLPEPGRRSFRSRSRRSRAPPVTREAVMAAVSGRAPQAPDKRGGTAGPTPRPCIRDEAFRVVGARERRRRMQRFEPVEPKVSFPELERRHPRVLARARRVRPEPRAAEGRSALGLLRRPPDGERQARHPSRRGARRSRTSTRASRR